MPSPAHDLICPECGAGNTGGAQLCWLCQRGLDGDAEQAVYKGPKPPVRAVSGDESGATFSLATGMLVMTLVAVLCGLLSIGVGLAVPAAIVMVPVFARTVMVVRRRQRRGLDVGPVKKAMLFLGSYGTAMVMVVVVSVAAVGTFCGVCLGLAAAGGGPRGSGAPLVFISSVVTLGVLGLLGRGFVKWIRVRWRRDTSR